MQFKQDPYSGFEELVEVWGHWDWICFVVVELWVVGVPDDGGVMVSVVKELVHAVWRGLYIYKI